MSLLKRNTDLTLLHPFVAAAVTNLLDTLKDDPECCSFAVWEAYRTPERQNHLFTTKTRTRSGKLIRRTKARAWQSMHQYGVAVDLVIDHPDTNRWASRTKEQKSWWRRMHKHAERHGLRRIKGESPHLQLISAREGGQPLKWRHMKRGEWPEYGSPMWSENIHMAIERFPKRAPIHGPPVGDEVHPEGCRPVESGGLLY